VKRTDEIFFQAKG